MEQKKQAIVLFSGGKDSFLTSCLLIEKGFKVNMVNFKTVGSIGDANVIVGAKRIIKKYGPEKASFLGVFSIVGIWRELVLPFVNMTSKETLQKYGNLTHSQFNCLSCRSAMYIWCVLKSQQMNFFCVGDGARKVQGFVIELPIMIEVFRNFFENFGIEFVCPVLNLESDWELKNQILARGFIPKMYESQCLLGAPLCQGNPDETVQNGIVSCFQKLILPQAKKIIKSGFPIEAKEKYI
jgi:hypothetical protein